MLELYEATFEIRYLKAALEFNEYLLTHFWDTKAGGFFITSDDAENILIRKKDIYDGAVPVRQFGSDAESDSAWQDHG